MKSTRTPLREAVAEPIEREELLDALAERPERVESGWTVLARDVEWIDGVRIPLLALDATGQVVALWAETRCVGGRMLSEILAAAMQIRGQLPMLRKILNSVARSTIRPLETHGPRLVVIAHDFAPDLRDLAGLVHEFRVELAQYRAIRVGDSRALEIERLGARPTEPVIPEGGTTESEGHRKRLLADARTRILNLSPEITALDSHGGLVFRYRGSDLARFESDGDALRLQSPRLPQGRRILGRSDLEDGLHAVIEEFFALYAVTPARAAASRRQHATDADEDSEQATGEAPGSAASPSGTAASPSVKGSESGPAPGSHPGTPPAGLRTAPLSREEIEEFLRPDDGES